MNLFQRRLDSVEEPRVSRLGSSAHLADVEMVDLAIQHVLEALPDPRKLQLANDLELLERLEVPVDARAVDRPLPIHVRVDFAEADAARSVVEDELKELAAPGGDAHPVGLEEREQILVPLHIARCCNNA
ncbi:MAG TPA: hypothetical protein VGH28_33215 [Polyangiaceae bacterium]